MNSCGIRKYIFADYSLLNKSVLGMEPMQIDHEVALSDIIALRPAGNAADL